MGGPDPRDLVDEEWEPDWLKSAGEGTWDPQGDSWWDDDDE